MSDAYRNQVAFPTLFKDVLVGRSLVMKRRVCRAIPLCIHTHKTSDICLLHLPTSLSPLVTFVFNQIFKRTHFTETSTNTNRQTQTQTQTRPETEAETGTRPTDTTTEREREREREKRELRGRKGGVHTTCDKAFCQVSVQTMSNLASGYMPRCMSMKLRFKELLLGRESLNAPFDLTTSPQPLTVDTGSCAVRNDARFAFVYVYVYLCVCVYTHAYIYTK